jgi:hypothetical protein
MRWERRSREERADQNIGVDDQPHELPRIRSA